MYFLAQGLSVCESYSHNPRLSPSHANRARPGTLEPLQLAASLDVKSPPGQQPIPLECNLVHCPQVALKSSLAMDVGVTIGFFHLLLSEIFHAVKTRARYVR